MAGGYKHGARNYRLSTVALLLYVLSEALFVNANAMLQKLFE